jgi:hypothetical protein
MHEVVVITIIHHSDGKYRVYVDLGAWREVADQLDDEVLNPRMKHAHTLRPSGKTRRPGKSDDP